MKAAAPRYENRCIIRVKSRANRQLLEFLARSLDLPPKNLALIQGLHSRKKTVKIRGLSREELVHRLARFDHTRSIASAP